MEVDGAAKNSGPTSLLSQGVIEAAETAAHAAEAKDNCPIYLRQRTLPSTPYSSD
jgi:hypothetical protein